MLRLASRRLLLGRGVVRQKSTAEYSSTVMAVEDEAGDISNVTSQELADITLQRNELEELIKVNGLTQKRSYWPKEGAAEEILSEASALGIDVDAPLSRDVKFSLLCSLEQRGLTVPNSELHRLTTARRIAETAGIPVDIRNPYEKLLASAETELTPRNLTVLAESERFNPDDPAHGGKTPFPQQDMKVKSIKYKRKYKSIYAPQKKLVV